MSEDRGANPVAVFRHELGNMETQFKSALPAHIPVERFVRVLQTAVQQNPALLNCTRRSLWNAAMKAAQDGLLPDGREGAIVGYKDAAQWMPMIAGLRKKVRNSGEIATWDAHVVYEHDRFDFELGDEPHIHHKPAIDNRGKPIAVYSIATLKSGEKSREVMSVAEIEDIRQRSRAKGSGPWVTDWAEMARKTVARRHSKVLPMSTDLDDLLRRDDELYDMAGAKEEAKAIRASLSDRLTALAGRPQEPVPMDTELPPPPPAPRYEAAEDRPAPDDVSPIVSSGAGVVSAPGLAATVTATYDALMGNTEEPEQPQFVPHDSDEYTAYFRSWLHGAEDASAAEARWRDERPLRQKCKVASRWQAELYAEMQERLAEIADDQTMGDA